MSVYSTAPIEEYTLRIAGRAWRIAAVCDQDALISRLQSDEDLATFPYGLTLWSSALGLAEALAENPVLVRGRAVLELGAGAGLPGIVAAYLGGVVTQTDMDTRSLALARRNADSNGVGGIVRAVYDWNDAWCGGAFDVILGSDVLYERGSHSGLVTLFCRTLAPDGQILIADPLRPQAVEFVGRMEADGWNVAMEARHAAWALETREIAIFSLKREKRAPGG